MRKILTAATAINYYQFTGLAASFGSVMPKAGLKNFGVNFFKEVKAVTP